VENYDAVTSTFLLSTRLVTPEDGMGVFPKYIQPHPTIITLKLLVPKNLYKHRKTQPPKTTVFHILAISSEHFSFQLGTWWSTDSSA